MACGCQKNRAAVSNGASAPVSRAVIKAVDVAYDSAAEVVENTPVEVKPLEDVYVVDREDPVVKEALEVDLTSCYECAKKHISRAQILFEEYHTGYPDHIKNLMNSMRVAESEINKAFQLWQKVQAHLDMASAEFLGNDTTAETMQRAHIQLANDIRDVRLKLAQNPLYIPKFDALLTRVQQFEYTF